MRSHTDTLVLGIGNTLLTDDGAGIHAMRRAQALLGDPGGVEFMDGSTLSFSLLPSLEEFSRWLVLDAGEMHRSPGTVAFFEDEAMDRFLGRPRRTAHEVGLADLIDMARLRGCLPERRALVAIQPARIDWGLAPTARVAAALDEAAEAAIGLLHRWRLAPELAP